MIFLLFLRVFLKRVKFIRDLHLVIKNALQTALITAFLWNLNNNYCQCTINCNIELSISCIRSVVKFCLLLMFFLSLHSVKVMLSVRNKVYIKLWPTFTVKKETPRKGGMIFVSIVVIEFYLFLFRHSRWIKQHTTYH